VDPGTRTPWPALYTALAAESPVVLLSGHASLGEIGRGGFQEMRQAELAEPVAKASWMVRSGSELEGDVEKAFRLALSGRPGPVHVSLPFDLLEAADTVTAQQTGRALADSAGRTLSELEVRSVLAALASAERPLILAGPLLCRPAAGEGLARLGAALKVPAIGMESPRGARAADPQATIIALSGDGAFGFHMAEFDTAVRYGLAFVAVIGNDAAWNAEHQIQLRTYGAQRAHGCELLPTRYDEVVKALGGHGELVTTADELLPALERAIRSGKPTCVNVLAPRVAAPVVRLKS
jgi:thiamine pyrophosphate-dependent acetolactate synthase large subunit-like protein